MKTSFKIFATILFVFAIIFDVSGQKLSKFYSFNNQKGGNLYFIYPFDGFKNSKDHSDFMFDITNKAGNEQIVFNFTYYSENPLLADSIIILSENLKIECKVEKLFIDFAKKKWQHRYSARINFSDMELLFKIQSPPTIHILSGKTKLDYLVKNKKWKKYSGAVDKILYIIKSENQ